MDITIIESKELYDKEYKNPISTVEETPSDGKHFLYRYQRRTFRRIDDALRCLSTNFITLFPLKTDNDVISYRTHKSLKEHFNEKYEFIFIDITNVMTAEDQFSIIKYFRKYKCAFAESRSNNNFDNFSFKGFLMCYPADFRSVRKALFKISKDIKAFGTLKVSEYSQTQIVAPLNKFKTVYSNNNGVLYNVDETQPDIDHVTISDVDVSDLDVNKIDDLTEMCLEVIQRIGLTKISISDNGVYKFVDDNSDEENEWAWSVLYPSIIFNNISGEKIYINKILKTIDPTGLIYQSQIDYDVLLSSKKRYTNVIKINEEFITPSNETLKAVDDFLDSYNDVLAIKSPMGSGKSTLIGEIIKETHKRNQNVLIITNRISVASEFSEKFKISLYNNRKKLNVGESLICQFDSLHKFRLEDFSVIIMDEFLSIMLHSRYNANGMNHTSEDLMYSAFRNKIVISDAFLTGYELNYFENSRNKVLIENEYRDNTMVELFINEDEFKTKFIETCLSIKRTKQIITASICSNNSIATYSHILRKRGLRVQIITADTSQNVLDKVYKIIGEPNTNKKPWDVLIYSPVVTVGVSILNNVKEHFHFDSSKAVDCISSLQMTKRSRMCKKINMYIRDISHSTITDFNELVRTYKLDSYSDKTYRIFNTTEYGDKQLNYNGVKAVTTDLLYNILKRNQRDCILYLMKLQFKDIPKITTYQIDENIINEERVKYLEPVFRKENQENDKFFLNDIGTTESIIYGDHDAVRKLLDEMFDGLPSGNLPEKIIKSGITEIKIIEKLFYLYLFYLYCERKMSYDDFDKFYKLQFKKNKKRQNDLTKFVATLLRMDKNVCGYINSFGLTSTHIKKYNLSTFVRLLDVKKIRKNGNAVFAIDENITKLFSMVATIDINS